MSTMTFKRQGSGGGLNFNQTKNVTVNKEFKIDVSVTGAKTGTLTTRTDNDTGTLTMTTGHGITTGARLDLYWVENGLVKCRVGMTVGTVAGDSVPIDLGTGDNLPVATTAIFAKVPQAVDYDILGTDVIAWLASAGAATGAIFAFVSNADAALGEIILTEAGMQGWHSEQDRYNLPNRLTGDAVGKVYLSHNSTSSQQMKAVLGLS